jgi:uncharacterized protein with PQ loop repeat
MSTEPPVDKWKIYFTKFLAVYSIAAQTWLALQLAKTIETKDTKGLSLPAFCMYGFSSIIWVFYGFFILTPRNWIMVCSSGLAAILSGSIVICIIVL